MDKNIQSDDIPRYPLALCEDQILLPLQKMLPPLPHHFLFPTAETGIVGCHYCVQYVVVVLYPYIVLQIIKHHVC